MGYPSMMQGVKPVEGGNYIFTDEQKQVFLQKEPAAEKFFRPFTGAQEFINGNPRWILILQNAAPQELRKMPLVLQRIEAVKQLRLASPDKQVREDMALRPMTLRETHFPENPFLVFPEVSSENRNYIPIGYLNPPMIPSNLLRVLVNAELWHFAILTSQMHMAWMRQFAGRLKSDYRYSIGVVYNTFPWPQGLQDNIKAQDKLNQLAQTILDIRAKYTNATLADLYHTVSMPPDLRKAHAALDKIVDKLYQSEPFKNDSERVALLFSRYETLISRMA